MKVYTLFLAVVSLLLFSGCEKMNSLTESAKDKVHLPLALASLKQMSYFLREYYDQHGSYPDSLEDLQTSGVMSEKEFEKFSRYTSGGEKMKFAYRPGYSADSKPGIIVIHTPKPIGGSMAYLCVDGSVETSDEETFRKLIKSP